MLKDILFAFISGLSILPSLLDSSLGAYFQLSGLKDELICTLIGIPTIFVTILSIIKVVLKLFKNKY